MTVGAHERHPHPRVHIAVTRGDCLTAPCYDCGTTVTPQVPGSHAVSALRRQVPQVPEQVKPPLAPVLAARVGILTLSSIL